MAPRPWAYDVATEHAALTTTGGRVWDAARRLASFLEEMSDDLGLQRPGLRVLELGSGLGWLGMTLARNLSCAEMVVITEQEAGGGLDWLRHNVSLNRHLPGMAAVRAEACDWLHYGDGGPGGGGGDGGGCSGCSGGEPRGGAPAAAVQQPLCCGGTAEGLAGNDEQVVVAVAAKAAEQQLQQRMVSVQACGTSLEQEPSVAVAEAEPVAAACSDPEGPALMSFSATAVAGADGRTQTGDQGGCCRPAGASRLCRRAEPGCAVRDGDACDGAGVAADVEGPGTGAGLSCGSCNRPGGPRVPSGGGGGGRGAEASLVGGEEGSITGSGLPGRDPTTTTTKCGSGSGGCGGEGSCGSGPCEGGCVTRNWLASQCWDLIIGSDLVYNEVGAVYLPRVMRALAQPGTRMLYCHTKHRFDTYDMQFFEQLAACGLECREVHEPSLPSPPPSPPPLTQLFPEMRIAVYDIRAPPECF